MKAAACLVVWTLIACSGEEGEALEVDETEVDEEARQEAGEADLEPADGDQAEADANTMLAAQWMASFAPSFVDVACQDGAYFRECYVAVDAAECRQVAARLLGGCASEFELVTVSREASAEVSVQMASCTGGRYEEFFTESARFKASDPACAAEEWAQSDQAAEASPE